MNRFEIEAFCYDIMKNFEEFLVVHNENETLCVGGIEYNEQLIMRQDFFNCREIPLFTNEYGEFVAKQVEWNREGGCLEIHRDDGVIKVFCEKPTLNFYKNVTVESIWDLCNSEIEEYNHYFAENGDEYIITNPARIHPKGIDSATYADIYCMLDAGDFGDKTLKFYFVRDYETRKFYMGLWDCENICPVNEDIHGKGNCDYSKVYDYLFPTQDSNP